jgi:UDP-4-amino-4,6-dideoxy-N-acetyl-beta-L-altrosamine transaminase
MSTLNFQLTSHTNQPIKMTATKSIIPYGKQEITQEDIAAVVNVLQSDYLTQGPQIASFEKAFADYVGADYAVAVSNGTAALHLCTLALGVEPGQKVITTPITFAASANCVRYCGGEVVFADIDRETYTLDINEVRKLLGAAPKGTYTGIIPVDFTGYPVDLEEFRKLADEYELWIIEDACHAPGGYFTDSNGARQMCGNGKYADLAIFSFHPVKHIAAGEGGMITTDNKDLFERLLTLRTHGITRDTASFENDISTAIGLPSNKADSVPSDETEGYPGWYMEMQDLGYNYRLTDFQAALGESQLKRADTGLHRRQEIAKLYDEAFSDLGISVQLKPEKGLNAHHLYIVEVEDKLGLYNYLREHGIYSQVHYIPLHLMPYYAELGWKKGDFPNAEAYYARCLSIPMYPSLSKSDQQRVISVIREYQAR